MIIYIDLNEKDYKKNPILFIKAIEAFMDNEQDLGSLDDMYEIVLKIHKNKIFKIINNYIESTNYWLLSDIKIIEKYWNKISQKAKKNIITSFIDLAINKSTICKKSKFFKNQIIIYIKNGKANPKYVLKKSIRSNNFKYIKKIVYAGFKDKFRDESVRKILSKYDKFEVCLYKKSDMNDYIKRRKLMRLLSQTPMLKEQINFKVEFTKKDLMSIVPDKRFDFLKVYYNYYTYYDSIKEKSLGAMISINLSIDDIYQALFSQIIENNHLVSGFINKLKHSSCVPGQIT